MPSRVTTVADYLAELPADRRAVLEAVRKVVLANIDSHLEEGIQYGMIGYYVPHRIYPAGYHCDPRQPLPYLGLAAQKNHFSLYLTCGYGDGDLEKWLRDAFQRAGKKLDMGKACLRFKQLDDLPLEVLAEALRRVPAAAYIKRYESMLRTKAPTKGSKTAGNVADRAAKTAAKPAAKTAAKSAAKPATKTAAKPAAKPAAKSAAKTAAKPAAKTAAKSQRGRRR
jgi:hypothetical protein